jgi:hypothetical protein
MEQEHLGTGRAWTVRWSMPSNHWKIQCIIGNLVSWWSWLGSVWPVVASC